MADQIQIGDIAPRVRYRADGTTLLFSYPFPIFTDVDLEVYVDGVLQTAGTDYAVSGAGQRAGGAVTFATAPADNAAVTLVRRLTIQRTSDFATSGEFKAAAINKELDFQAAALQQINDDLVRSIRLPATDPAATLVLPAAAARAGKVLSFDDNGDAMAVQCVDISAGLEISASLPLADSGSGDAGVSPDVSAADHAHPLPDWSEFGIASQAEAEAGADDTRAMTPLRARQAMQVLGEPKDRLARDTAANVLAYVLATNDVSAIVGGACAFYIIDSFSTDSLSVSTGATHDTAGGYYHNSAFTEDLTAGQTYSASSTYGTSVDAVFDDNPGSSWNSNAVGPGEWVEVQFSDAKEIRRVGIHHSLLGSPSSISSSISAQRYNGGAWTTVATFTDIDPGGGVMEYFDLPSSAADTRWRLYHNDTVPGYWGLREVEMMESATPQNMTLKPSSATLGISDPSDVLGYFVFEPDDDVTFGVDVLGAASIDDGATFATGTWTKVGNIGSGARELYRLEADVSGQTGSALTYRVMTANAKHVIYHDCIGLVPVY